MMNKQKQRDNLTTEVYSTAALRGAAPTETLPEKGTTPQAAYRLVKDETYAIQRPFVLVTKEGTALTETAQAFFDFITSEAAREVISAAGVVPAN